MTFNVAQGNTASGVGQIGNGAVLFYEYGTGRLALSDGANSVGLTNPADGGPAQWDDIVDSNGSPLFFSSYGIVLTQNFSGGALPAATNTNPLFVVVNAGTTVDTAGTITNFLSTGSSAISILGNYVFESSYTIPNSGTYTVSTQTPSVNISTAGSLIVGGLWYGTAPIFGSTISVSCGNNAVTLTPGSGVGPVTGGNYIAASNTIDSGSGNDRIFIWVNHNTGSANPAGAVIENFHPGDDLKVILANDTGAIGWTAGTSSLAVGNAASAYGGSSSTLMKIAWTNSANPDLYLTLVGVTPTELKDNYPILSANSLTYGTQHPLDTIMIYNDGIFGNLPTGDTSGITWP
jgi:hypothetical protein